MRIVFFLSRVPWPLDKGDKLRAYYQIKYLSANHEIILIALSDNAVPEVAERVLLQYCKEVFFLKLNKLGQAINIMKSAVTGNPFQVGYFYNKSIFKQASHIINTRKPDVVFFQLVRTAKYAKGLNYRKVIDYQDALSEGLKRRLKTEKGLFGLILRSEYKRMLRYEEKIFDIFDEHIIITEADRDHIPHPGRNHIKVIPNGINTTKFHPRDIDKRYDIIFAGNMNYPPNVDAAVFLAKEIFPRIKSSIPGAKLLLAGANPAYAVSSLQSDDIKVTGWVEDIAESYASAKVFIAPMRIGTGLQNKLLEAMATGLPCVTTTLANNALKAKDNSGILIGNTAAELANAAIKLLSDSDLHKTISAGGRNYVLDNFSWENISRSLEDILKNTIPTPDV